MIVFDASAVVSAALREDSVPERALLRAEATDLFALHPWRGVPILQPAAYLAKKRRDID